MLGVEFDPPDNIRKIKSAFEEWKKKLTTEQNTTVDPQRLNEIREELAMSSSIATMIDNPNFRKMYADKLKEKRVEQLKNYISLIRDDSGYTLQVTRAQMKKVSEKLHLSLSTVEATYRQEGFEIKNPRNKTTIIKSLNEFFISDNVMGDLRKNFSDFKTTTDFKRYPWASSVNDLYELAAKLDKSVKKPNSYRYLSADELSEIFRLEAQQIAEPIPIWHSIKSILNIAQMQIFNSNENRYRYDHSLNLEPEHMQKFFANLKAAPDIFKTDPYFANNCIDRIQKSLPGVVNKYELAVALYNKVVGLLNDPYEPVDNPNETVFYVTCGNCQTSTQFRTREAIQQAKCPTCGESFYKECPNCHRKIPATAEHCNYCNFSLVITCSNCHKKTLINPNDSLLQVKCSSCGENFYISCPNCHKAIPSDSEHCNHCKFPLADMRNLSSYIQQANEMLAIVEEAFSNNVNEQIVNVQMLMTKVFEIIAKARIVNANDLRLKSLEDRINKLVRVQKQKELESWAKSKIPSLSTAPDKAVADCLEIITTLQKAGMRNYRPVLDRLRLIKPKTPVSITATIKEPPPAKVPKNPAITNKINVNGKSKTLEEVEEIKLTCTVTWQPANDLGVKYQLVRKVNGVPQNNNDGEMLIDKTEKLEFEDKNIVTGISYGYAVFAVRVGTVSNPATCEVIHYSDIEENKLIARTGEDGFCHFSWTLPSKNCLGVRILRTDSYGNLVVIADRVQSSFTDRAVGSKKQYYYRLQCVYYAAGEREAIQEHKTFNDYIGYNEVRKINHKYEYSEGLTVKLMPESPPVALQNITYRVLNERVIFNWQSTGEFTVLFREMKNNQLNIDSLKKMGNRIELSRLDNILGSNKIVAKADSRNQTCEFKLTEEFCKIAIISATQTLGVICDVVTVANITPCTINTEKTSIDNGKLKIILNSLPDKLVKIHYAVTNKNMHGKLYMTVDDAKSNQMRFVFAKKYELDKVIIVHSPPQMELYLTVIGEYKMSNGSVVYSEPSTEIINNSPKAEISYWLEWGVSGIIKKTARAKNCKLILESTSNYTPTLYLAYNKNGGANIELEEHSTVKLYTIRESKEGLPNEHVEILLDNAIWEGINEGTVIKLLPSKKDAQYFDIRPAKPESLKVPPK